MLQSDAVLDKAHELKARGKPFVLATVVRAESPTSAKPGAKALITADGELIGWIGGGCAQPAVLDTAKKALKDGQSRLIRVSPRKNAEAVEGIVDFGMTCHSGGTLDIFIDPVIARPVLLVIGASPVAQALSSLAQHAGFAVHAAFPGADAAMFPGAVKVIDGLAPDQPDGDVPLLVVVATQGKRDEAGLEAALQTGSPYIAFVASGRKAAKLKQELKARGHDGGRVDAIVAPAGVEIGAVTPEEIAVSVLAGCIQVRRRGLDEPREQTVADAGGQVHSCCGGEAAPAVEVGSVGSCCGDDAEATAVDPVCGMTVRIAGAEYVSHHAGSAFYFCCAGCQRQFEQQPGRYLDAEPVS